MALCRCKLVHAKLCERIEVLAVAAGVILVQINHFLFDAVVMMIVGECVASAAAAVVVVGCHRLLKGCQANSSPATDLSAPRMSMPSLASSSWNSCSSWTLGTPPSHRPPGNRRNMNYLSDMQQRPSNSKTNIPLIIAASTSHDASLIVR